MALTSRNTPFAAIFLAGLFVNSASLARSELSLTFVDPAWDGKIVPKGQQCSHYGGKGATPAIAISGIPDGTTTITVAFSDESYQPMNNGGHGTLSFAVAPSGGQTTLPSVPGETGSLPAGVTIAKPNNTNGTYLQPGYMPPCSGASGNLYSAKVTALDASKKELATGRIELGRY